MSDDTGKMQRVHYQHSVGGDGESELEIKLYWPHPLSADDKNAIYKAADAIMKQLHVTYCLTDPDHQRYKKEWIEEAVKCFDQAGWGLIYTKQIPNEYCGDQCCPHMPWLNVTTEAGVFKVGWRKRVIHLEWFGTEILSDPEEAFPDDDSTKGEMMIHCWGYEKLRLNLTKLYKIWREQCASSSSTT